MGKLGCLSNGEADRQALPRTVGGRSASEVIATSSVIAGAASAAIGENRSGWHDCMGAQTAHASDTVIDKAILRGREGNDQQGQSQSQKAITKHLHYSPPEFCTAKGVGLNLESEIDTARGQESYRDYSQSQVKSGSGGRFCTDRVNFLQFGAVIMQSISHS